MELSCLPHHRGTRVVQHREPTLNQLSLHPALVTGRMAPLTVRFCKRRLAVCVRPLTHNPAPAQATRRSASGFLEAISVVHVKF